MVWPMSESVTAMCAHVRLRKRVSQRTQTSYRALTEAEIILSFGSPSSPTEGLKIAVFPGKRHQTRHLDFCILRLLTEMFEVRILPVEPTPLSFNQLRTFSRDPSIRRSDVGARITINRDQ